MHTYFEAKSPFVKSFLTGVFVSIVAALACLAYDMIYRDLTGFSLSAIVNVSSIIFGSLIIVTLMGILYYAFVHFFGKAAPVLYIVIAALLTLLCVWKSEYVVRSDIPLETTQFRGLLIGMVLVLGISGTFAIPFLYSNKGFLKNVI